MTQPVPLVMFMLQKVEKIKALYSQYIQNVIVATRLVFHRK